MKKIFTSPITYFNLCILGFFILIQSAHLHTHYTMDMDVDSYVRNYCKKNLEKCKYIIQ